MPVRILDRIYFEGKADRVDTFYFPTQDVKKFFQKEEITIPDHLVDEFSFSLLHKDEVQPFVYSKVYAADVMMQQDLINQHY